MPVSDGELYLIYELATYTQTGGIRGGEAQETKHDKKVVPTPVCDSSVTVVTCKPILTLRQESDLTPT